MRRDWYRNFIGLPLALLAASGALSPLLPFAAPVVHAEEPVERFLEALREARLNDYALKYLERIDPSKVEPVLAVTIDYQRAKIFLSQADEARNSEARDQLVQQAEKAIVDFITANPTHSQSAEASLRLGGLKAFRADILLRQANDPKKPDPSKVPTAAATYGEAFTAYQTLVDRLRTQLEELKGAKIDPADVEKKAFRDSLRTAYLEAQYQAGRMQLLSGKLLTAADAQGKQRIEDSVKRFQEITDKYAEYMQGVASQVELGDAQVLLQQHDAAIENYTQVVDLDNPNDLLRPLKARAMAALVRTMSNPPKGQTEQAIERGQAALKQMRRDEETQPDWSSLQLALAEAYRLRSESPDVPDPAKRQAIKDARRLAKRVARSGSPETPAAEKLLSALGVGDSEDDPPASTASIDVSTIKTFDDGIEQGRLLVESLQGSEVPKQILRDKIDETEDADEKERLTKELQSQEAASANDQLQASAVLERTLQLVSPSSDPASVSEARQFLAFIRLQQKQYEDAVVLGEFVARRMPSDPTAVRCGVIALMGYQQLLIESDDLSPSTAARFESLASYLAERWPGEEAAQNATDLLVRLSIDRGDVEKAKQAIAKIPATSSQRDRLELAIGRLCWNQYSAAQKEGNTERATAMLSEAAQWLSDGLQLGEGMTADEEIYRGAVVQAMVRVRQGDSKAADAVLRDPATGPLPVVANLPSDLQELVYRVALQAVVANVKQGTDSATAISDAEKLMEGLRTTVGSGPDGGKKLVSLYYGLADDIREQIDATPAAARKPLVSTLQLMLDKLSEQATEAGTMHWAARTLSELSESLRNDPLNRSLSEESLATAAKIYDRLLQRAKDSKEFLSEETLRLQVEFELARVNRRRGEFKKAIETLAGILQQGNNRIDAQIEAALTYQEWAAKPEADASLYTAAISGGRPDPNKPANKLIWGWGKISQRTMGNAGFREQFFEARYRLIECRILMSKKLTKPEDKEKRDQMIKIAKDEMNQMDKLYPDLGGDTFRPKFQQLKAELDKL
jgi:tetratricopeptide (TPR) repeat protein